MSWTRDQARALADKILAMSKAPACEVTLNQQTLGNTRFAANDVTTAGISENLSITITSIDGARSATTMADTTDETGLGTAVARNEALLATVRPNPEAVEPLGPQDYPDIAAFDEPTAQANAAVRSQGVKAALDLRGAEIFPLRVSSRRERAGRRSPIARVISDSIARPRPAIPRRCDTGRHGFGLRRPRAPRLAGVDAAALAQKAAVKAESSAKPRHLRPVNTP